MIRTLRFDKTFLMKEMFFLWVVFFAGFVSESLGDGLNVQSVTVAPYSRVVAGGTLVIRCNVKNSSDRTEVGYLVGKVDGWQGEEDRRKVELLSGEQRLVDVRLRLPPSLPPAAIDLTISMNVVRDGREVIVQRNGEPMVQRLHMPLSSEQNITAIRMDIPPDEGAYWRWPRAKPHASYELAAASRFDSLASRQFMNLDDELIPLSIVDWNCVNTLVVADPFVFDNAANIGVVRQFLQGGGRVWIQLDKIDTDQVRGLLSDEQQIETLDTILLNRFEVELDGNRFFAFDKTVDVDIPVALKRIVQIGGEVVQSIQGWPTALWMKVGQGELLFTTLESSAWTNRRGATTSIQAVSPTPYTLQGWGIPLAHQIHANKNSLPLKNMAKASMVTERIGNPIVPRSVVATVLIAYCACLLAVCALRVSGVGLRWLGVITPSLAVVAAIPLFATAMWQRRDIPSMVSSFQFVQIDSRGGALARETCAVYVSEPTAMELSGQSVGIAFPSSKIEAGVRSITTNDLFDWRMTNADWPAGTWRYEVELALPEVADEAKGRLTEQGLVIEMPSFENEPLEDVVVAMVPGAPSLVRSGNQLGKGIVDGSLTAEGDRWTADTIVNDEQRRRSSVYRELFDGESNAWHQSRTLFGWSKSISEAPKWSASLQKQGSALIAMPIRIPTPDVGSAVRIPHNLVRVDFQNSSKSSVLFSPKTGKFISESTLNTHVDLEFILPPEVTPLDVQSIDLDWDVQAPQRTVTLSCLHDGEEIELVSLKEPSIPFRSTVKDPRVLKELRDGRIELRATISGGDGLDGINGSFVTWRIRHLRMSVSGRTLPRNSLVDSPVR